MEFALRLTNPYRLRWLLGGWAALLPLTLALALLHLGWLLPGYYLALLVPSIFYNWLLRQPGRVLVAADGVAWANPADRPPVRYQFAELRAYRFDYGRADGVLTLYPRQGTKTTIRGQLYTKLGALQPTFEQAVRRYNQANPTAPVAQEPSGLAKFFTSPLSTWVLWGLLTAAVALLARASYQDRDSGPYVFLALLVLLPYAAVWANFYNERRP